MRMYRKMSYILPIVLLAMGYNSYATECPPPPRLNCEQLKERMIDRCPPEAPKLCPTCTVCAEPTVVTKEVKVPVPTPVPGPERIVTKEVRVEVPARAKGQWYLGAGPLWHNEWGATAVGGYKFANGITLLGGPTWIPQYNEAGSVNSYRICQGNKTGGHGDPYCTQYKDTILPREGANEWGGQLLLIFPIGGKN